MAAERLSLATRAFAQWLKMALPRMWLAFSILSIVGFVIFLCIDHDNPLRSDDPYIVGIFFGITSACLSAVYSLLEAIATRVGRAWIKNTGYAFLLSAWSCTWWAVSYIVPDHEGAAELVFYLAAASLGIGVATWPLCRFTVPKTATVPARCMGAIFLLCYFAVAARMALR